MATISASSDDDQGAENAFVCSSPRFELDYDAALAGAEAMFATMFPGEEFLPRAPEPEEIIIGGEEEEEGKGAGAGGADGEKKAKEGDKEDEGDKDKKQEGDGAGPGGASYEERAAEDEIKAE